MEIAPRVEVRQKLSLTPEMRQRLAVLGMNAVELRERVEQEALENPALETEEHEPEAGEAELAGDERALSDEHAVALAEWDQDLASIEAGADWSVPGEEKGQSALEVAHRERSFEEYLLGQLGETPLTEGALRAARAIIHSLDEDGYLRTDLADIARQAQVGDREAEDGLAAVHALDPPGVGARDLQECLLIQLRELGSPGGVAARIVESHLEDLAAGRRQGIARALHVTPAEVAQAADLIRSLNPRPASAHSGEEGRELVIPEFAVREVDGELVVLPIAETIPTLRVSRMYQSMVRSRSSDETTLDYLRGRLAAARRFVRDVERRKETLGAVAQATVESQREFFLRPDGELVPLKLEDVAERLGLHPSTVSRAVNGKYIDSARGVIELRRLFGGGLPFAEGAIATDAVRRRIKELVSAEPKDAPFSDARLTELLRAQGVAISRRTVAKYREQLGIPGSWKRRRH